MNLVSRSIPPFARAMARRAAAFMLIGALTFTTGCFGLCPLTKATYKFNKEASENEFVQSVMFWFLSPIYGLGMIGDVLVLNPVEFWSGQTLDLGVSQAGVPEVPYEVSKATNEMLGVSADAQLVIRCSGDGFEIRDADTGKLAGSVHPSATGGAALYNAEGQMVRDFPRVS